MMTSYEMETLDDLARVWSMSSQTTEAAIKCLNLEKLTNVNDSVSLIRYMYPDVFNDELDETVNDMLYEGACRYISENELDGSKPPLSQFMKTAMTEHITAMNELEEVYSGQAMKYSEKFFDEQYDENCKNVITVAFAKWLYETSFFTLKFTRNPNGKRAIDGNEKGVIDVTKRITRNGPCPCGSGKKYKNCCGADKI